MSQSVYEFDGRLFCSRDTSLPEPGAANGWKLVPGYERAPDNLQFQRCGLVLAGMGRRAIPWGLSVQNESAHLVLRQGRISPAALFWLGIACLWKALRSTIKQASASLCGE